MNNKLNCYNTNSIPRISFLGPKGSYSYLAVYTYASYFFKNIIECSCLKFSEIFKKVENNLADYAILPIENINSGSINDVYDLLQKTNLFIINELNICINHCILVNTSNVNLDMIETIYSHPQPFQQCSKFIQQYPNWKIKYTDSTASAMKKIAILDSPKVAVLGNEIGASIYKLKVLKRNLANYKNNYTRFIVLAKKPVHVSKKIPAKTTLIISSKHRQQLNMLIDVLLILHKHNLIISKLESRPIKENPWKNALYVDIKNNVKNKKMQDAIHKFKNLTYSLKILGCYPINDSISN
ncbi:MAG: bifunctional chorismate mutase/prephenate dehydratase [Pantoea sp. Brub]|nr:bifunctional chorismate mutase/prephenate dehydratase [Pantoea sp. Brub]